MNMIRSQKKQSGVGMIEVLIAILVFAVGVLGMIAMQLAAKRASYEATQRSIATSLNRDIIERMRSNPQVLENYEVDEITSRATPGKDCSTTACDPKELAIYDLWDWVQLMRGANETVTIDGTDTNSGGLVDSMACITHDDGIVTVAIAWKGVNEMLDPNDPCGEDDSLYSGTVSDQSFRRVQTISTYISDE